MSLKTTPTPGDTSWFVQDRFGMFIHWGLFSLPARHEWVASHEGITTSYDKYFRNFDPDLYDPELWAKAAADAGMKYFVITTKHHEGFCLWDSKFTDYKVTNTPYGKDLLRPMVEAFQARGLRTGLYHSLIDWHHPDFLIDDLHPLKNSPERDKLNESRDQMRYADYLHSMVRELLTDFGKIEVLWLDYSYPVADDPLGLKGKGRAHWRSEELYKMVRELQPHVILNERLDLPDGFDMRTPEQFPPREWVKVNGEPFVWEACHTFSGSWGYNRDEDCWKSVDQLVKMLIDSVSKGGNMLLNIGPTGRGEFDERTLDRLSGMGEWMKRHSRSIYGCTQAPEGFQTPQDCRLTYNPSTNRMYVHVFSWPCLYLHLDSFLGRVEYAQLLNDASEIPFREHEPSADVVGGPQTVTLTLPAKKPNVTVPVIELILK